MTFIPNQPQLLTREQIASALTAAGFPISAKTLASRVSRGGGPPFQKFGHRALYRLDASLDWAHDQLSPSVGTVEVTGT